MKRVSSLSAFTAVLLFVPLVVGAGEQRHSSMDLVRSASSAQSELSEAPLYASDRLIVKLRDDLVGAASARIHGSAGATVERELSSGYELVRVPEGQSVEELARVYENLDGVESVEFDAVRRAQFVPNDPNFDLQWNLGASHLNMPAAWEEDQDNPKYGGDSSVVVAVIDTGVAYENHGGFSKAPDFANTNFVQGRDIVNNDAHPNDDHGHGTHVAMTIAQSANNGVAEAGIAYNTSIMPIKALDENGFGFSSDISDAVDYAIDNGADVINMSLGGYGLVGLESAAVDRAVAAGVIVVAASGNGDAPRSLGGDGVDGTSDPVLLYPAAFPEVLAVGSVGYDRRQTPYSNYGANLDIVAPGGDLTADRNSDGFPDGILQQTFLDADFDNRPDDFSEFASVFYQGTSMATPHVAAAAALLLADGLASNAVVSRLTGTAQTDMSGYSRNRYGAGMLDAAAMFSPNSDVTPPPVVNNLEGTAKNKSVELSWENPGGNDFVKVRVYRQEGITPPLQPGEGRLVYEGSGQGKTDTSRTNGTLYSYSVFSYDSAGNASSPVSVSVMPSPESRPSEEVLLPDDVLATPVSENEHIRVSWKKPSGVAGVLVRRDDDLLSDLGDSTKGRVVYKGGGTSFVDEDVVPQNVHSYTVFAYTNNGVLSRGIGATALPGSPDVQAPSFPEALSIESVSGDRVRLSWDLRPDGSLSHALLVRVSGSSGVQAVTDGSSRYTGLDESFTDVVPRLGETYTYGLFGVDNSGNASLVRTVSRFVGAGSIVTAPGPGGGPHVRAFGSDGSVQSETNFFAYADGFRGGVRLALGDIDADGEDEIIAGAGKGGGPQIRVFEKDGSVKPIQFFAFHPDFRGGIDVAAGDVTGNGEEEIAACQFSEGQAWVKVYRYNNEQTVVSEFNAFGAPEVGCTVTLGDIDADGADEIIVGAGAGGGPQVRVFEADGSVKPIQFFAFHPDSRSGIDVAAGDVDGNGGKEEIIVSQLQGEQAWVKVYRYNTEKTVVGEWNAYGAPEVGASVSAVDLTGDGAVEILTGPGPGGGPQVRGFSKNGTPLPSTSFFAYDSGFRGGVSVAGGGL